MGGEDISGTVTHERVTVDIVDVVVLTILGTFYCVDISGFYVHRLLSCRNKDRVVSCDTNPAVTSPQPKTEHTQDPTIS